MGNKRNSNRFYPTLLLLPRYVEIYIEEGSLTLRCLLALSHTAHSDGIRCKDVRTTIAYRKEKGKVPVPRNKITRALHTMGGSPSRR